MPDVFRSLSEDARPAAIVRDWIEDANAAYLVAVEAGRIIGFLNVRKAANPRHPMFRPHEFAMIENAVVERTHRGRGIGAALFNAAIAWALEHGLKSVQTMVWSANQGTKEFYLR